MPAARTARDLEQRSARVGIVMAVVIADAGTRTVDIHAIRPPRLDEGLPIRASHEYRDD